MAPRGGLRDTNAGAMSSVAFLLLNTLETGCNPLPMYHLYVAFEFDSNCQALGGLAVRVEFKCFVSAPFSIVLGSIFDRFRHNFPSFSVSLRLVFDRFRLVFGSF